MHGPLHLLTITAVVVMFACHPSTGARTPELVDLVDLDMTNSFHQIPLAEQESQEFPDMEEWKDAGGDK